MVLGGECYQPARGTTTSNDCWKFGGSGKQRCSAAVDLLVSPYFSFQPDLLVSCVKVILQGLLADEFHEWCCDLARGRVFCRASGDWFFHFETSQVGRKSKHFLSIIDSRFAQQCRLIVTESHTNYSIHPVQCILASLLGSKFSVIQLCKHFAPRNKTTIRYS